MFATALFLVPFVGLLLVTYPREVHEVPLDLRAVGDGADRPPHRLEIGRSGVVLLNGTHCRDSIELRVGLDLVAVQRDPRVELRVDPEARYETFVEVLAIANRANLAHIEFDPPRAPHDAAPPSAADRFLPISREDFRRTTTAATTTTIVFSSPCYDPAMSRARRSAHAPSPGKAALD